MTVTREMFKNAIRRGANPGGSFDGITEEVRNEVIEELKHEDRSAFKAEQATKRLMQIALENEKNA